MKLFEPEVEQKALKVPRVAVGQLLFDQNSAVKVAPCVSTGPFAGNKSLDVVKLPCLKGFQLSSAVFINLVSDAVKVEHATPHVQVLRPIAGVALISDVFTKIDLANAVGAAAQWRVGDDLV